MRNDSFDLARVDKERDQRLAKQAVWDRIQTDMPEFVPTFTALAKRFGVRQVAVQRHGGEWITWEAKV